MTGPANAHLCQLDGQHLACCLRPPECHQPFAAKGHLHGGRQRHGQRQRTHQACDNATPGHQHSVKTLCQALLSKLCMARISYVMAAYLCQASHHRNSDVQACAYMQTPHAPVVSICPGVSSPVYRKVCMDFCATCVRACWARNDTTALPSSFKQADSHTNANLCVWVGATGTSRWHMRRSTELQQQGALSKRCGSSAAVLTHAQGADASWASKRHKLALSLISTTVVNTALAKKHQHHYQREGQDLVASCSMATPGVAWAQKYQTSETGIGTGAASHLSQSPLGRCFHGRT